MTRLTQDRLIRKEVALALVRERTWPMDHIGLRQFAPFMDVGSTDVIFEYLQQNGTGLAPARAEDAEAELIYTEGTLGEGRASLVDWALKNHYSASDVDKYRETVYLQGQIGSTLPLSISNVKEGFEAKLARDTAMRRTRIDNILEWLIMQALWNGQIVYDDGKVKFTVDFARPSGNNVSATAWWNTGAADPITDILTLQQTALDTYGITIGKAVTSLKVIRKILTSDKFAARSGLAGSSGPSSAKIDPNYLIDGWGYEAALAVIERATGVKFQAYDAVYNTRTKGSTSLTQNRFSPDDKVLFLPTDASIAALDDGIGFGKTMTAPHPEGNWTPGYYEWEKDTGPDPWGYDVGTGIQAFPVFPHMDLTFIMRVI